MIYITHTIVSLQSTNYQLAIQKKTRIIKNIFDINERRCIGTSKLKKYSNQVRMVLVQEVNIGPKIKQTTSI